MIDDLIKVAEAMDRAGICGKDWHPKLKTMRQASKKAPCVRVWLDANGHIKDVESLPGPVVEVLRKYEPDLGRSLPGFNVRPLYRVVKQDQECSRAAKEIEAALKKGALNWSSYTSVENDFWAKTRDGLAKCFGVICEELQQCCQGNLIVGETLDKLFRAVKKIDIETFQAEYCDAVRCKIEKGELPVSLMCYFVTEEKKQKEDASSRVPVPTSSVYLDVADYDNYPVASQETMDRLNSLLWDAPNDERKPASGTSTAMSLPGAYGRDASGQDELFPPVTLPVLGGIKLRSQVAAIPAQSRYGYCESKTFSVGKESRKKAKRALEWMASREENREGMTFGQAGDGELLFAYPKVLPKSQIPIAKMLGAQSDSNLHKLRFESLAKSVIEQLKGSGGPATSAELEIFFLRKMDKARTKVVYYRNITVASLEEASLAWQEGCRNIPALDVRDWAEMKSDQAHKAAPVSVVPCTVFPVKIQSFLNAIWRRDGKRADTGKSKVSIFCPADGLRLLLENPCDALAAHMLEQFIQHAQGYFVSLCCSLGMHKVANVPDKTFYPSILGLLLQKNGKRKDEYMNESAFWLGRFLRIADEIHRLYCEVVRNKQMPPELCGSALLIGMMEAPGTALSQLALRSAPYVKWARGGADKGDKGGLVGFWLKQWGGASERLHTLKWPQRMTPDERAQVFLGYLSSIPKSGDFNADESVNNQEGEMK